MASIEHRTQKGGLETWRVIWREDGHKQQQTYHLEPAAVAFKKRVEAYGNQWPPGEKPERLAPHDEGPLTFGAWALRAVDARTRANERTKADYRRDLARHFAALEHIPLADVDAERAAVWLADRRKARLADKTIRNLWGFASSIMADACAQHPPLATHNPFARGLTRQATVRAEEMCFLTHEEFATVLRYVLEPYRPLIRFLAGTGARYGEATALQVRDVELLAARKTVSITKAWKRTGPASWVVGEPKTPRSRRTLSLSPELVELLIPLVSGRKGSELLFTLNGLRLPHIEVYKRGWAPAVARARVCETHYAGQRNGRGKPPLTPAPCDCAGVLEKAPRIHDLRHSHASWLLEAGLPMEVISRRLGHSSANITDQRYAHLRPGVNDEQINDVVDRALSAGRPVLPADVPL